MNKLATFSQKFSQKSNQQGVQGSQNTNNSQIISGDRLERDIASRLTEKSHKLSYSHLSMNDLGLRSYKGHFMDYYWLPMPEEIVNASQNYGALINGLVNEIWSAYFSYKRTIVFWSFEPSQNQKNDFNFYFNPSTLAPFPSSVSKFSFELDSDIVSIKIGRDSGGYFHIGQSNAFIYYVFYRSDLLLCIATHFSIFLYRICYSNGHVNDMIFLNYQINTNGEQVQKMYILGDSLLVCGSYGSLRQVYWQNAQYTRGVGLFEQFSKQIRRMFNQSGNSPVIKQIEVDLKRQIVYVLISVDNESKVHVYDLRNQCRQLMLISQDSIRQRLVGSPEMELCFIAKVDLKDAHLLCVMKQGDLVLISLGESPMDSSDSLTLNGTFEVKSLRRPQLRYQNDYCLFAQDPHGVQMKQTDWQLPMIKVDGAYSDQDLLVLQWGNVLSCQFSDMAQVAYEAQLSTSKFPYQQAMNFSVYKNTSLGVIEYLNLRSNINDIPGNESIISGNAQLQNDTCTERMSLNFRPGLQDVLELSEIESKYLYSMPSVIVSMNQSGANFTVQIKPVDILFMTLKVTHIDLIERSDSQLPLQVLVQAIGLNGTSALAMQILSQQSQYYMVSKELEEHMSNNIREVISSTERIPFSDKYSGKMEDCPIWVVGRVYLLQGSFLTAKVNKFLQMLMKRERPIDLFQDSSYFENQSLSPRLHSLIILLRRVLFPLYDVGLQQLRSTVQNDTTQLVIQHLEGLVLFMQGEYRLHEKKQRVSSILSDEEQKPSEPEQRGYLQGFNYKSFNSFGMPEQQRPMNFFMEDSSELDQQSNLVKIYNFGNQCLQFLKLVVVLKSEDQDINCILSAEDKVSLNSLSLSSLFMNPNHLLILKLLLNSMTKQYTSRAKEFHSQFSWFFDELDFKVIYLQDRLDSLLQRLMDQGLILCNSNGLSNRLRQLFKIGQQTRSLNTLLQQGRLHIVYTDIQDSECVQNIITLLNELAPHINHIHFYKAFKAPLLSIGMHSLYLQALFSRCNALINSNTSVPAVSVRHSTAITVDDGELQDCENIIVSEFQFIIEQLLNDQTQDQKKINEILYDVIDVVKAFQMQNIHQVVIKKLVQQQQYQLVIRLKSPFIGENSFDAPLLKKYELLYECGMARQDQIRVIEYSLKIARFNFLQHPEFSYEQIQNLLPLSKRLDYLFDAEEHLTQLQMRGLNERGSSGLFREYSRRTTETMVILKLQKIVFDCLLANPCEEIHQIVRQLYQFQQLQDFMISNDILFAQILAEDYSQFLELPSKRIDLQTKYTEMAQSASIQCRNEEREWPGNNYPQQIKFLYDNLLNRDRFFILEIIIQNVEELNFQGNYGPWLAVFLSHELRIPHQEILRAYFSALVSQCDSFDADEMDFKVFFLSQVTKVLEHFIAEAFNEMSAKEILSSAALSNGCGKNLLSYKQQIQRFFTNQIVQNIQSNQTEEYISTLQHLEKVQQIWEQLLRQIHGKS